MKISEIITDKYKLRLPPTVYYDLLADVAEAEEEQEPKKGHWYNPLSESGYFCTNCESNSDFMYPYCPHCGARMNGAE